ncbi:transposase family protein [Azospirillum sp. B21]|uniref:transposase family protein n=1 Tax=Azospirillum sp. B21 TaxID=2607496 RepID=UPI00165FFBBC
MTKRLLPVLPDGLCIEHVLPESSRITIFVRPRHSSVLCPRCHVPSSRVHSRYERRLADLPWQGRPVILRLQARRFPCREANCPKRTFTERLPASAQPSARRSERLIEIQRHIAPSAAKPVGGSSSASLCRLLPIPS